MFCGGSRVVAAQKEVGEQKLREALGRLGEHRVDLVIDARKFPDRGNRKITGHPGFHPENMQRILWHKDFGSCLADVWVRWRRAVAAQMKDRPGKPLEMVVAVYCRSGKHRSLAIAECLRHIGEIVEGLVCFGSCEALLETGMGQHDVQMNV